MSKCLNVDKSQVLCDVLFYGVPGAMWYFPTTIYMRS